MSSRIGKYVILFEKGPGYILSKALSHGSYSQFYLVISLEDGKAYVQKKLDAGGSFRELFFYRQPTSMVPKLISKTSFPEPAGDAAIFRYCNRADFRGFKRKLAAVGMQVPEVIWWLIAKEICSILEYIHHGSRRGKYKATTESRENVIIHNDLHEGNVLIHFQDGNFLPSVLLGNWGCSYVIEKASREDKFIRKDPRCHLDRDLKRLITLVDECPAEFEHSQHSAWHPYSFTKKRSNLEES